MTAGTGTWMPVSQVRTPSSKRRGHQDLRGPPSEFERTPRTTRRSR